MPFTLESIKPDDAGIRWIDPTHFQVLPEEDRTRLMAMAEAKGVTNRSVIRRFGLLNGDMLFLDLVFGPVEGRASVTSKE